jgi:hypothetical protein
MNPTEQIDQLISELNDWRGEILTSIRKIIHDADPDVVEEWKWKGVPVWSDNGVLAFANAFKDKVKLGFLDGASLPDPDKLFNAELEGNKRRAIEFYQGDTINKDSLKTLIQAAATRNKAKKSK